MARGFWAGPAAIANRPGYLRPLPKSSGARIARQAAHSTAALPRTAPHDSALPGADCRARIAGRGLRARHRPRRTQPSPKIRRRRPSLESRGTALHDGKNNAFSGRPRRRPAPCAPCDPPAGRARRLTPPARPAAAAAARFRRSRLAPKARRRGRPVPSRRCPLPRPRRRCRRGSLYRSARDSLRP